MTALIARPATHALPEALWPEGIRLAWQRAVRRRGGRSSRKAGPLSETTCQTYSQGIGHYLGYLHAEDPLSLDRTLTDLVTPERMDAYLDHLQALGRADYTILMYCKSLYAALRLIDRKGAFGFVVKPDGIHVSRILSMRRRAVFVPDARHNVLWAEDLFRAALTIPDPMRRRLQVRDAAMIGILAELAPRARAMQAFRLGHNLVHSGAEWILRQEGPIMKDRRSVLELPLSRRAGAILDRYIAVERRELLQDQGHDALWVANHAGPLGRGALDSMIEKRSMERYGISFGPHRFRTSLTTTRALIGGDCPLDAALILGHSPRTSLRYYNRANAIEAARAHDAHIAALEDDSL